MTPAAPLTPQELLDRFAELGIAAETIEHAAVFTVAESRHVKAEHPGRPFQEPVREGQEGPAFLVTARDETAIDLKRACTRPSAPRGACRSARPSSCARVLGVEPGSVTPFAVVNDREGW